MFHSHSLAYLLSKFFEFDRVVILVKLCKTGEYIWACLEGFVIHKH